MSSQKYNGHRQGRPRHPRNLAGYGIMGQGSTFPPAPPAPVPASQPIPAPPSQPHISLPAVTGLEDGELEAYEEGLGDDPFGPSPTYEPSLISAP